MPKEIGGYIELEKLVHKEYHSNMIKLNCANAALLLAIKEKHIKKIYFPYYLCDSVFNVCLQNNIVFEFYNIDEKLRPEFNIELGENEYLYFVNFYGLISNEEIAKYKSRYKNIIVDNVQAFFQRPLEDTITVYSCRKFFGVPDGAYLNLDCNDVTIEDYEVVHNRLTHLVGRQEFTASEFYSAYTDNESHFSKVVIRKMSKFTDSILGAIPYDEVIKIRKSNFEEYYKQLSSVNQMEITDNIIAPFCYPLYVENGAELRKEFIKNKIYIPTLWPNIDESQPFEFDLKQNLIQLPCDQRYSLEDVKYICGFIR